MSNLIKFDFEGKAVRTVMAGDDPQWIAKDVCEVLGLVHVGSAMRHLEDDERGVHIEHTPGGPQEMATITESGLYALIFRSRKPVARRFRKWVTSEVLPTIRKTGGYGAPAQVPSCRPSVKKTSSHDYCGIQLQVAGQFQVEDSKSEHGMRGTSFSHAVTSPSQRAVTDFEQSWPTANSSFRHSSALRTK